MFVTNGAGSITETTADLALCLLLGACRHLGANHQMVVQGGPYKPGELQPLPTLPLTSPLPPPFPLLSPPRPSLPPPSSLWDSHRFSKEWRIRRCQQIDTVGIGQVSGSSASGSGTIRKTRYSVWSDLVSSHVQVALTPAAPSWSVSKASCMHGRPHPHVTRSAHPILTRYAHLASSRCNGAACCVCAEHTRGGRNCRSDRPSPRAEVPGGVQHGDHLLRRVPRSECCRWRSEGKRPCSPPARGRAGRLTTVAR